MQSTATSLTSDDAQQQWTKKYQDSIVPIANNFELIAKIDKPAPGLEVEIRRFFWKEIPEQKNLKMDICYLSLAITPRPLKMKIDYLGTQRHQALTAYGNCCFIPAGQNTYSEACIGEYQEVCCLFDPALFEPHINWNWTPLELASCFNIKNMNIQNHMLRLAEEAKNPGYGSKQLVKALFDSLLIELSRHFRSVRSASHTNTGELSMHQLRLINEKVKNSLSSNIHIDSLADLCGVSGRHLSRMFKKTTGYTLGKYISYERINLAKFLLSQPQGLVKEVAFKCGFKSQSSFSQAFHEATGLTPSQYRNQLPNN